MSLSWKNLVKIFCRENAVDLAAYLTIGPQSISFPTHK